MFAVTTGLPARSSSSTWSPAGSSPPITSATTAISGSSRISAKSVVVGDVGAAILRRVADERADDAQPVPGRPLDVGRLLAQEPVDRRADRPVAEQGNRNVDGRHAPTVAKSSDARGRVLPHPYAPHAMQPPPWVGESPLTPTAIVPRDDARVCVGFRADFYPWRT